MVYITFHSAPLLSSLIAAEEVDCDGLTKHEWLILHQIEITLETMADYQRILEGECYVTGSLVPVAIYQIRKSYVDVLESADANPDVVTLTEVLLKDFDKRYVPADPATGKVAYHRTDDTGAGNRYIGVHQYFFFAAILDPCIAPLLPSIMTDEHYMQLKDDIVDLLVAAMKCDNHKNNDASASNGVCTPNTNTSSALSHLTHRQLKQSQKMDRMFRVLNVRGQSNAEPSNEDDEPSLRRFCEAELERYLREVNDGACPLRADDGSFNDPLVWWKANAVRFAPVAKLARKFLAIPATSAPSERIWSRAAKILSLHRASLNDELVARIMYVRENLEFFLKHYRTLAKKETPEKMHHLIEIEMDYLPISKREEEGTLDIRAPCLVPLRVLLYAQDYWKFNHLECAMCVAPAMFVSLNVYLPPEPPLFVVF